MITVGRKLDTRGRAEVVIRNLENDTVLVVSADPEDFAIFANMVVDELDDLDPETNYSLEEYDVE